MEINIKNNRVNEFIEKIHSKGGTCYIVGGYVRDSLIKRNSKDIDIEVYNIKFDTLQQIFGDEGKLQANFGVLILKDTDAEFAIPRYENKIGIKHIDFEINLDPYMNIKEAAYRRDFTINSIMYDLKSKELVDPYNGIADLQNKKIKHIGDKFSEDPLRILRAIRFSFELGFIIDDGTYKICFSILNDLKHITPSRKNQEISKMLNVDPQNFKIGIISFEKLLLTYFNLGHMSKTIQNPLHHPEGDVWEHTKQGMYLVNLNRDKYTSEEYKILMLAVWLHDIGKIYTTKHDLTSKENITSYGHEEKSVELAKNILDDILINKAEKKFILNLIEDHMRIHLIYEMRPFSILKLLNKYNKNLNLLIEIGTIDKSARLTSYSDSGILRNYIKHKKYYTFLLELYNKVEEEKKLYNGHYFLNQGYTGEQIKIKQQDHLIKFIKKYMKKHSISN